jgi:tetratricopeptide (TPR) repeat protein
VLSEDEYRRIEGQIIDRCHIRRGTARELYPWYFHYELGLELLKHQDPSRALGSLLEALDRRETPERYVRTYGMWYLNYAPYYNIGRAHYLMGSYDCAADAFKMSETLQELDPAQPDFAERRSLLQQSSNKAGPR